MRTRQEIKARGKEAFMANYWKTVLASFVLILSLGVNFGSVNFKYNPDGGEQGAQQITEAFQSMDTRQALIAGGVLAAVGSAAFLVITLIRVFLLLPLETGGMRFMNRNLDTPAEISEVGYAFSNNYFGIVLTMFLRTLFTFLWTLLFIIPGVVKMYSYRLVPFILSEHPEITGTDAITLSRKMMDGNKGRAFMLDLSFIGWAILTSLTCGLVGIFYANPYYYSSCAAFYRAVRDEYTGSELV